MNTLGIDISSHAIDLVLLNENDNTSAWTRLELDGGNSFDRTRDVPNVMPGTSWYEKHGVYLVAVERPFGASRKGQDIVRLIEGAVVACIPRHLALWEVTPSEWKQALGVSGNAKKEEAALRVIELADMIDLTWPQDAYDAWAAAHWARETNRALLERRAA